LPGWAAKFQTIDAGAYEVACHRAGVVLTMKCPRDGEYGSQGPKYLLGVGVGLEKHVPTKDSSAHTQNRCDFAGKPEMDALEAALIQRCDPGVDAASLAHFRCFDLVLVLANHCLLRDAYFDFDFAGQLGQ